METLLGAKLNVQIYPYIIYILSCYFRAYNGDVWLFLKIPLSVNLAENRHFRINKTSLYYAIYNAIESD